MRFRPCLWFAAFIAAALIPNLAAAAGTEGACPVTAPPDQPFVPPAPYSPDPGEGAFWYGTNTLWTRLPVDGVWRGLPNRDNEGFFNKLFLWKQGFDGLKEPEPDIILSLKRLDAEKPLVSSRGGTNAHFDNSWTMLTGVLFPTEGCWEITIHHDGNELTFVLSIQP